MASKKNKKVTLFPERKLQPTLDKIASPTPDPPKVGLAGRPSKELIQQMMQDFHDGMTIDKIAEKYNKPVRQIKTILKGQGVYLEDVDSPVEIDYLRSLRARPEYKSFCEEFTNDEMHMFEHEYVKLMQQFAEDNVLPAEENQIFMSIRYWILIHRNLVERKKTNTKIEKMEKDLLKLMDAGFKDPPYNGDEDAYKRDLAHLDNYINSLKAGQVAKTAEHKTLTDKHESFMQNLKATRNQRIERLANSKNKIDFISIILELEDEENRRSTGLDMELMKMAMKKEKERMGTPILFANGEYEPMILDSETVDKI